MDDCDSLQSRWINMVSMQSSPSSYRPSSPPSLCASMCVRQEEEAFDDYGTRMALMTMTTNSERAAPHHLSV